MFYTGGKMIVIEGGEGSGKSTQAKALTKALQTYSRTSFFEFPRYKESAFGKLTERCLKGEFGDFLKLSPYLSSLPYMLDRARARYLLIESLTNGHVVCDRYTPSNIVYQAAKLPKEKRAEFTSFIEQTEYRELGLPVPDLVIYLSVPVKVTAPLIKKNKKWIYLSQHGEKNKKQQAIAFQQTVVDLYKEMSRKKINWYVIDCMQDGKLLSRKEIHNKVMKIVKRYLNLK